MQRQVRTQAGIVFVLWIAATLGIVVLGVFMKPTAQAQKAPALPVPSGIVMFWPLENGPIPAGWHAWTPGQDRFLLGASPGARLQRPPVGGTDTINLDHIHGQGSLTTVTALHAHGPGDYTISREAPPETVDVPEVGPEAVFGDVTHGHNLSGESEIVSHSHAIIGQTGPGQTGPVEILPKYVLGIWIQKD